MGSIEGKVAIITGSSRGIGKALAMEMAKKGAKIILNGRNENRLNETFQMFRKEGFEVKPISADVSVYNDCKKLINLTVESYGKIDILINNAGLTADGKFENSDSQLFKTLMNVNYLGSIYPTQLALPYIKESHGSVLFISSLAAIHGLPNHSIYSSTKMALTGIAESLKIELNGTGVHIGIAYIGFTQNDPDKTIYNEEGSLVKIPKRKGFRIAPVESVAKLLIKMIEKRKNRTTFSVVGKLFLLLNRLSPSVVNWILQRSSKSKY